MLVRNKLLKQDLPVTPQIAYVVGYCVGDGHINFRNGYLESYTYDASFAKYLEQIFSVAGQQLRASPRILNRKGIYGKMVYRIRLRKTWFARWLVNSDNEIKYDSLDIFLENPSICSSFIAGLWDAEGTIIPPERGNHSGRAYLAISDATLLAKVSKALFEHYRIETTELHIAVHAGYKSVLRGKQIVTRAPVFRTEVRAPVSRWASCMATLMKKPDKQKRLHKILAFRPT